MLVNLHLTLKFQYIYLFYCRIMDFFEVTWHPTNRKIKLSCQKSLSGQHSNDTRQCWTLDEIYFGVVLYTKKYLFMGLVTNQSKPGPKKLDNFFFPRISEFKSPLPWKTLRFPENNKNKENPLDQICELFNNSFNFFLKHMNINAFYLKLSI